MGGIHMRLWQKLSLMTALVLLLTTGLPGAVLLWHSVHDNEERIADSYERQLHSVALALEGELNSQTVASCSEVTRNSYLNFLVKKYGADQYILLRGSEVVCNETPFEPAEPEKVSFRGGAKRSFIQKSGLQYVLVAGEHIYGNEADRYTLMLVEDISEAYAGIRKQAGLFGICYGAGAVLAVIVIFFSTRKMLKPLQKLKSAAEEIQAGRLTCRAEVKTRDEIGVVAEAFNSMAERIEEQVTELSGLAEQRRQMLGSLAHEMKTPMTSIIGYADTLLHVNVKQEQRERALFRIHEESRRLERLGNKLMNLIGLYENDSIFPEKTDMAVLFARAVELVRQSLEQKKISIQVKCRMEEQLVDRDLMESLLVNLLDNGIKASETGSTIFLEGKENTVTVRDQGCGIAAEEVDRVTEAFYMADKARSRKEGGCGLGLFLCGRIAQLHGAKLLIESEEGRGTCVSLHFPSGKEQKSGTAAGVRKGLLLGLICIALSGCGRADMIVVPRETAGRNMTETLETAGWKVAEAQETAGRDVAEALETAGRNVAEAQETAGKIRDQVQAPDVWKTRFSDGRIAVKVDAKVKVPDAEGISLQKVTGRTFSWEEYEAVNRVLFKGEGDWLYTKERTKAEGAPGWTKEEIDAQIAALEEKIAAGEDGKTILEDQVLSYGQAIEVWEKKRAAAPGLYERERFSVEEALEDGADTAVYRDWTGYVPVGDKEYYIHLDNGLYRDPQWRDICFEIFSDEDRAGYRANLSLSEQEALKGLLKAEPQEVTAQAEALVKALGLEEYRVYGGEFVDLGIRNTPQEVIPGYLVHFTRTVGGTAVNYGNDLRSWLPVPGIHWEEERLDVLYDDRGFAGLVWKNPYRVEVEEARFVELLSFEQIQDIFRTMLPKKYEGLGGGQPVEFAITEIRLGYMRSREQKDAIEATLIPVWDFYGTRTLTGDLYDGEQAFYPWLTINAMDGTVIER